MTSPQRIIVVAGARPNFVKVAPLMEQFAEARARGAAIETLLVHTGQHYDAAMSHLFFEQMGIPRPDVNLEVGSGTHAQQTGEVLARFEPVVRDWRPDAVVVVGDVNSTLACALVAAKLHVKVAHVEAGLRSFDRSMPEEINRVCTDAVCEWLFVTEPSGVENLRREGTAPEMIHLVGNVMIDSLRKFLPPAKQATALGDLGLLLAPGNAKSGQTWRSVLQFALVTLHRPSNVDERESLERIMGVLQEIGRDIPVVFPVHPRTLERIESFGLNVGRTSRSVHFSPAEPHPSATVAHPESSNPIPASCASEQPGVAAPPPRGLILCPPLGYLEFLQLESEAALVLTDSGGIQEETTALGVPCLTLRENTERPITVTEGTNTLVGSDPARILAAARQILAGQGKRGRVPPLWDGRAAERIVNILLGGNAVSRNERDRAG
jgi:UDP-N-acetylglucosamine 2-epimerase (non-hydrolysing)